jgi:hypothetical protein
VNYVEELSRLIRESGLRATFDMQRDITKPCVVCGEKDEPRNLRRVGTYTDPQKGNLRRGDAITRPVCKPCQQELGLEEE